MQKFCSDTQWTLPNGIWFSYYLVCNRRYHDSKFWSGLVVFILIYNILYATTLSWHTVPDCNKDLDHIQIHLLTLLNLNISEVITLLHVTCSRPMRSGEKGRDLTQSYDKSPYTHEQSKTPPKTSLRQRLRTVSGGSVGVTIATQLRFTLKYTGNILLVAVRGNKFKFDDCCYSNWPS